MRLSIRVILSLFFVVLSVQPLQPSSCFAANAAQPLQSLSTEQLYLRMLHARGLDFFIEAKEVTAVLEAEPYRIHFFTQLLERDARAADDLRRFAKLVLVIPPLRPRLGAFWLRKYEQLRESLLSTTEPGKQNRILLQISHTLFVITKSDLAAPNLYDLYTLNMRHPACFSDLKCLQNFMNAHGGIEAPYLPLSVNQRLANQAIVDLTLHTDGYPLIDLPSREWHIDDH